MERIIIQKNITMTERNLFLLATDRNHQAVVKVHAIVTSYGASDSFYEEYNNGVFFYIKGFVNPNDAAAQIAKVNRLFEEWYNSDAMLKNTEMLRNTFKVPYRALNFSFEYQGRTYSCVYRTECDCDSVQIGHTNEVDMDSIDENLFRNVRFELAN